MNNQLLHLLATLALLIPTTLPAQSTAFTYQGHLHHAGTPATGLYEISFSLHDAETNGSTIGTPVTLAPVPVTNGLFTATLDFGAAAFNGANRWLELSVTVFNSDQPVVTLAPRQPITAAPHALYAANAASALTLGGFSAGSFWRLDGNAGTTAGTHFLGTTDNQPLEFKVNGVSVLRIYPNSLSQPSIYGGSGNSQSINYLSVSKGCTISGGVENGLSDGGSSGPPYYCVIGGGNLNYVGGWGGTIGGGLGNFVSGISMASTIAGGEANAIRAYAFRSTIGGGFANEMFGRDTEFCTIAGGAQNIIQPRGPGFDSQGDTIGGGMNNTNSGGYGATIAGGTDNYIGGRNPASTISGGQANTIPDNVQYATIPGGYQAVARRYGQFAHASGQFASAGDAQTSTYICRANTTDATVTEIFLDGAGERMVLPANATWTFDILVTGRTPGAASAGYQLRGVIENNGGTTALIGTVNKTILAEDTAAWDVTAVADDTNDALIIRVTGAAGADIRWVASVRTVEVSY